MFEVRDIGRFTVVRVASDYAYVRDRDLTPGVPAPIHRIFREQDAGELSPFDSALKWVEEQGAK